MLGFRRKRSTSRQAPPISLIVLLVGFILVAFVFIGFRQVKGAQERRLRLLAGFGERVESTVGDLAERFVRIVRAREEPSEPSRNVPGEPRKLGQPSAEQIASYLEHVPNLAPVQLPPDCDLGGDQGRRPYGSVELTAEGPHARLDYCPPPQIGAAVEAAVGRETETAASELRGHTARLDLRGLVEPTIVPGAFDSVVLADSRGRTLFQQGEPELRMLELAPLLERPSDEGEREDDFAWIDELLDRPGSTVDSETFRSLLAERHATPLDLGARTAMVEVEVAGSEYYVFLQPVAIRFDPPDRHRASPPERWVAVGVTSSQNLLSSGLTTSPFLLFVLVSIVPLAIITWPFLKLSLVTRRQPFQRLDLAALLFATVLGISLAALLLFDLLFLTHLHQNVDRQLALLADGIEKRFRSEVGDALDQLVALNERTESILRGANPSECNGQGDLNEAPRSLGDLTPVRFVQEGPRRAAGQSATRQFITQRVSQVLTAGGIELTGYPYFDSVFWATSSGDHGCSTLPLVEAAVLPSNVEDRDYFRCARDCDPKPVFPPLGGDTASRPSRIAQWEEGPATSVTNASGTNRPYAGCETPLLESAESTSVPLCLQPLLDRTTGQSVTALAIPGQDTDFPVAALVARLTSVGHPVLPPAFGFAIVAPDGRVLYHSEARRDLSENFLDAADENPLLRSLIQRRRQGRLGIHYWGQPTRVHVQPMTGLPWTLITFRGTYDLRVQNFELIYDFLNPFLLYLGGLLLIAVVVWWCSPKRIRRFLWPSSRYLFLYKTISVASFLLLCLFTTVVLYGSIPWTFRLSLGIPFSLLLLIPLTIGLERLSAEKKWRPRGDGPARWRVGVTVVAGLTVVGIALIAAGASVLTLFLSVLAAGQGIWLIIRWFNFSGKRRQVAYTCALGSLLMILTLIPALGFFHLARSRQVQVYTQDRQLALAERLEERRQEISERQSPLRRTPGREALYEPYENRLEETKRRYLAAVGVSPLTGSVKEHWLRPPWPHRHADSYARKDGPSTTRDERPPTKETWASRILSARPFPLNDLSARQVESDLSRFEETAASWTVDDKGSLVLSNPRLHGVGRETHLVSRMPRMTGLPDDSGIAVASLLLGGLLLGFSPFRLAGFLADRVALIALVGKPDSGTASTTSASHYAMAEVASTPIVSILRQARRSHDPVRRVVLVSTLPTSTSWKEETEAWADESEHRSKRGTEGKGKDRRSDDAYPPLHAVDFRTAWKRASDEEEAEVPTTEEDNPRNGEEHERLSRCDRFLQEIRPDEDTEPSAEVAPDPGQDDPPRRRAILLTHFEPDLEDPSAAADQVEALHRLSTEDSRSLVILTETVPDPETLADDLATFRDPRALHLWTEFLAAYAVEHGQDADAYPLAERVDRIGSNLERIENQYELRGPFVENMKNLRVSLGWITSECSPTPVLRRIGHATLGEIENVAWMVEDTVQTRFDRNLPEDRAETRDALAKDLEALEEELRARTGDKDKEESPAENENQDDKKVNVEEGEPEDGANAGEGTNRESAAAALAERLADGAERGQNPGYLLRLVAPKPESENGWRDPLRGAKRLEAAAKALEKEQPSTEEDGTSEQERHERWRKAIEMLESEAEKLRNEADQLHRTAETRKEMERAQNLFQLMTTNHIIAKVGTQARLHYRYLWSTCTTDEKLVLVQLAKNGLVNPKYFGWVMDLMNRGLVVRDPKLRVMNESFARFIRQETQRSEILKWQEEGGTSAWSVFKWILPAPLVLVAALLFITQRDALSNITGVLVAIVSLAPILVNLYGQFEEVNARREIKSESADEKDNETKKEDT